MFFGRSQTAWLDIKKRRPESSYPPPSSSTFRSSTTGKESTHCLACSRPVEYECPPHPKTVSD